MSNNTKIIDEYLTKEDWRVKENSNMGYSLSGLNSHIVSAISSEYWLENIYPENIASLHRNGDIHIHDLQLLSAYCFGLDLQELLRDGFGGVPGKVQSNPPKHFRTALGQAVNFLFTIQNEVAGAVAFSNFDTLLAPYVRYDGLTQEEVKQAIQEFVFNMNVSTRTGGQSPFSNITLDLVPAGKLAEEFVFYNGALTNDQYKDFQDEIDMINIAFADVMIEGDGKGRVFSFPIPTYNVTKDFAWDSPAANKIFEMTAKYGIPYFSNFVNSDMHPDDSRSMCCRLRISIKQLAKRGGGLFGSNAKTGSIGVVTINLPRLGYECKTVEDLMQRLGELMDLASESLELKRAKVEEYIQKGLYPYTRDHLKNTYERFGEYWKNHFSTIGLIGMNELLLNFEPIGDNITSEAGRDFAETLLEEMQAKLLEYQEKTGNIYNLEATPAEGTTRRLAALDKARFIDIITANEDADGTPYYTNSTQLPVGYTDDIFGALNLQDGLQTKYSGGTTFHVYLGEAAPSAASVKELVKKISHNYHLPYFTITPTFSICPKHGYLVGEHEYCPKCDEENFADED